MLPLDYFTNKEDRLLELYNMGKYILEDWFMAVNREESNVENGWLLYCTTIIINKGGNYNVYIF